MLLIAMAYWTEPTASQCKSAADLCKTVMNVLIENRAKAGSEIQASVDQASKSFDEWPDEVEGRVCCGYLAVLALAKLEWNSTKQLEDSSSLLKSLIEHRAALDVENWKRH